MIIKTTLSIIAALVLVCVCFIDANAGEGKYQIGTLRVDANAAIPSPGEKTLDLSGYKLTFDEEFDELSVSAWGPAGENGTRWIAHTPWHGDFGDAR